MAIYIGILGVLIIIAGIVFSRPSDKKINLTKLMYGASFVLFGVFLLFWASLVKVRDGYLGVLSLNGKIQTDVLKTGWHVVNPMGKVIQLDARADADTVNIVSAEGSEVKMGLTVVYHLIPRDAAALYKETGTKYKDKVVGPVSRMLLAKNVEYLYASGCNTGGLDELQARLNGELKDELRKHGLKVEKIIVNNFVPRNSIPDVKDNVLLAYNNAPEANRPAIDRKVSPHIVSYGTKMIAKNSIVLSGEDIRTETMIADNIRPQLKLSVEGDVNDIDLDKEIVTGTPATSKAEAFATVVNTSVENNVDKGSAPASADCKPMDENSFGSIKKMIQSGNDTYQKLTAAERVITTNCFTSDQVSDFVNLLPTADAKLEFAKQAYLRTVDRGKYSKVADIFDKRSKRQLGKYIMHLHLIRRPGTRTSNEIQAGLGSENGNIYTAMCSGAMDERNFDATKKLILASGNELLMLQTAKTIANCNCFTSDQVLDIVKILPTAFAKLEFAKEAYKRTTDRRMFVKVAQSLDSQTRKILDSYVMQMYASK